MRVRVKIKIYIFTAGGERVDRVEEEASVHHLVLPPVSVQVQKPVILEVEVMMKWTIEGDEEADRDRTRTGR